MSDTVINLLLAALVIVSCLLYGSVTNFGLFITEILAILVIVAWFADMALLKKRFLFVRLVPLVFFIDFLAVVLFQILPLPAFVVEALSPSATGLYKSFLPDYSDTAFLTLSIYPQNTLSELFKVISYFAVFVFTLNLIRTKKQLDIAVNTIIFFGFFISLFGIIQKYSYSGKVYWFNPPLSAGNPFGPFANRNNFSGYINMIIPLTLGYFLSEMPLSKRFVYGTILLIMSLALFLSLSRGGLIIYLLTMIFVIFLSFFKSGLRLSPRMISVCILLFCCFLLFFGEAKAAWQKASTLLRRESFVVLGHGYSWLDILRICRDFPVFGTGLGTFGNISSMYKSSLAQNSFIYAHNDCLQLFSETGVIGFSSIVLFFILYFYSVLKSWFSRRDSYVVCVVLGGLASVFSMLTYSFLDFNLHIPATALLFFVILGLVYRLSHGHFEDARAIS